MSVVIDITAMVARTENLPNRVRHWRKQRGLTLTALAERLGSNNGTISRLETGDRVLDVPWMQRFARALDVSPADLLNVADNPLAALDDEQRFVIDTMLQMGAGATRTLQRVAEGLREFDQESPPAAAPQRA